MTFYHFGRHVSLQNNVNFSKQKGKILMGFGLKSNSRLGFEQLQLVAGLKKFNLNIFPQWCLT